ncbi:MAG TPA: metallophosphoesterase [Lacunisphaera sp.]|nr:metallophosphoesterase [Lacunisphaera sp.]
MKRRAFLRTFGAAVAVSPLALESWAASAAAVLPPPARQIPEVPLDAPAGTWTLVVLPDTQNLAKDFPEAFVRQTEWIVAHRERHDIRFVLHEGDITNNNTPAQWRNARDAMNRLGDAGIPYALLPGNHDLGADGKCTDRTTLLNDYFTAHDYRHSRAVRYFEPGRMENSAHELQTPAGDLLVVALEFGPRDAVLAWANEMVANRPEHAVIVVTHAYLYSDGTRYDLERYDTAQRWNPRTYPLAGRAPGEVNDGEQVWRKFVSRHRRIRFVLSGHVLNDGAGYLVSGEEPGSRVHQVLANYQAAVEPRRPYGGGGFLRLMQFLPDRRSVRVKTYSPWLDTWLTGAEQQFTISLSA